MTAIRYALILALVFLPASPLATTFPVTKTADTNGNCTPGNCSLREAIDAANTNPGADDVPVPAGFYLLTLGQLVVSDGVSIAGAGQTNTIIDGNASDRVFLTYTLAGGVAEISDVTIQNGSASEGGGIRNAGSGRLRLTNSTVSGNTAGIGGGLYNRESGRITLTNSTVSGNTSGGPGGGIHSGRGGGIYNRGLLIHLIYSTVSDNTAPGSGGGIFNLRGGVALTNSTVSGNTSDQRGGGIYGGFLRLTNSTVSGNTAVSGGGILTNVRLSDYGITVTNSTVSGNTATSGGGIYSYGGGFDYYGDPLILRLVNSTVSGNTATSGGGIATYDYYTTGHYAVITPTNTIVADNSALTGANCELPVDSLGYNLTDDDSCGFTEPTDLIVADAMLGPLQDNGGPTETHDLLPGSPAIDAGSVNCPPPDTDQRGVSRPQGMDCDIGAVEFAPERREAR